MHPLNKQQLLLKSFNLDGVNAYVIGERAIGKKFDREKGYTVLNTQEYIAIQFYRI